MTVWTFSPDPAVERTVQEIRRRYPPLYPAGLDRPLRLFEKLGSPHLHLPPTFHVAGTNGKGSTLAFLQAVFEAEGKRVHKFVSPHLVRFEERIVLAGQMISADVLLPLIEEVDRAAEGEQISFFEFFTALAMLAYARTPADALLLETGLGGLYDATNVVEKNVALITTISNDHNHILGATLPEIAAQKAGIIKQGCPAVIARQPSQAVEEVFTRAGAQRFYGRDFTVRGDGDGFVYESRHNRFRLPLPALPGAHQLENAALAIAGLEAAGYALKEETLARAMHAVRWPGRLQRVTAGALAALLPEGWELWLDGAHNESGAAALAAQAQAWGGDKPLHLITAMKKTKSAGAFYAPLLPYAATVRAVETGMIDAPMLSAAELAAQIPGATVAPDLAAAIRSLAFQFATPQRILVTGSLYLVGYALR